MQYPDKPEAVDALLLDGGNMGALIRSFPWERTPLGPLAHWPQSALTLLSVCLNAPSPAAVWLGGSLNVLYNDAMIPIMGDRHPNALGISCRDFFDASPEQFSEPYWRAMKTGKNFMQEGLEVKTVRNGRMALTYWDFAVTPVRGEGSEIAGLLVIGAEITARVRADRAAKDSADRLEQALSAGNGVGTWDWDVQSDLVRSDARFAHLYGVPVDVAQRGAPIAEFFKCIHRDDIDRVGSAVAEAIKTGAEFAEEYRLVDNDKTVRWVLAQGQCELAEDGRPLRFPGVSFDITSRKHLEEALGSLNADLEERVEKRTKELIGAQEALRQAQKMEAVGQLTGGIAHDFNNILQGVIGSLKIATRRLAQGRLDDVPPLLSDAVASADRAAALTHRLLAFSRRQPLDPRSVDVNDLIGSLKALFRRTLGESIELDSRADPHLWHAHCDPHQLESALLNLVINARDAMDAGGKLTIAACNADLGEAERRSYNLAQGDFIRLSVTDTGSGMSEDTTSKAFEPFFTTKPTGRGTGLGLSMVYGFALQSDGAATIDSTLAEGTTVALFLPRGSEPAVATSAIPDAKLPREQDHVETILVVEDEIIVRDLVCGTLRELGYEVLEAADGIEGVATLRSGQKIDLLVTDIGLPGLDGRKVAEAARADRPDFKILFITGYAKNAALASDFLEQGMSLLLKPFDLDVLATRVRELLGSGRDEQLDR